MDPTVSRRAVLAVGVAGAGAAALAACSSNKKGSGTTQTSQPVDKSVAKLADIPVGQAVSAKLPDGSPAIVARPTDSSAACFSAICTHMGCTVNPDGKELKCPCHGSVYDATTGAVKSGPAPRPLPKIAVHVANGDVLTS